MTAPWSCTPLLSAAAHAHVRERMAFDHCKWDPQVGDTSVLAPYAVVITPDTWAALSRAAESLASEIEQAEAELLRRPGLTRPLGLPRRFRKALHRTREPVPGPRIVRFDFHLTADGWKISEANTDVPGGLIEAGPFAHVMAESLDLRDRAVPLPGPSEALARVLRESLVSARSPLVALVHATAYIDDRQVMQHLANTLREAGLEPSLAAPDAIEWMNDAAPRLAADRRPIDALVRFFPAEWLPNLPARRWHGFLHTRVPSTNPPSALVTQSKRLPIVWDRLETPMPTWRSLLPETRDPRRAPRNDPAWVLKPALGRVGSGVAIAGVTPEKARRTARRAATLFPRSWIAQRRFDAVPLRTPEGDRYPCLGVYVVAGRAAGIYGRLAPRPLIDAGAQDVAVLLAAAAPIAPSFMSPAPPAFDATRSLIDARPTRALPHLGP